MKNTNKHALSSSIRVSRTPMKNKTRLALTTAFFFGVHLNHLTIRHINPFIRHITLVVFLRTTYQNETSKSYLTLTKTTHLITMQWQPSSKGGIILYRLLVSF